MTLRTSLNFAPLIGMTPFSLLPPKPATFQVRLNILNLFSTGIATPHIKKQE
jgi:hypothetical protein